MKAKVRFRMVLVTGAKAAGSDLNSESFREQAV